MTTAREDQTAIARKAFEAFIAYPGGRKLSIKMSQPKRGSKLVITIQVNEQLTLDDL